MSDLGGKLVAAIADGLEYVSCAVIRKFASQAADQHIDQAVQHVSITSACQIEQLISREHATGTVEKSQEQIKFCAGEFDFATLKIDHRTGKRVGCEAFER